MILTYSSLCADLKNKLSIFLELTLKMNEQVEQEDVASFVMQSTINSETFCSDKSSFLLPQGPIIKSPLVLQQPVFDNETQTTNQSTLLLPQESQDTVINSRRNSFSNINNVSINNDNSTTVNEDSEEISGFPSFVTNDSAIERERHVKDKFNGILYHVIPTYNQISVLFSTKGLYSQFISSLNKELHSRSPNKEKPIYNTHLRGKKCTLSCDKSESTIVITGPGNSLWRETTFLRLSLKLFQTFAAENKEDENKLHHSQSSTPVESRHRPCNILPLSPIDPSESMAKSNQPTMLDVNRQLNVLCQITKSLQGQINKINDTISQLLQKANDPKKLGSVQEHLAVNCALSESKENNKQQSEIISLNESSLEEQAITPGTKSYSEVVITDKQTSEKRTEPVRHDRAGTQSVSSKKKSMNPQSAKSIKTVISQRPIASKTLIIGDSILSGINKKGLNNDIECHPIPGATVDIVMEKIKIYDLKCFKNIIIYVAGNDASCADIETIEEKYEQLLYMIRDRSAESKIYLCSICPRGDTSVDDINDIIKRQCDFHEGMFINVNNAFYNKRHQLKSHFYSQDNIHLSPSGIKGLLGAINRHIEIVKDFNNCVLHRYKPQNDRQSKQRSFSWKGKNRQNRHYQFSNTSNSDRCYKCGLTNHETSQCFHKT